MIIYVVHALKYGDIEKHGVIVSAVELQKQAFDIAINYEWYRGGKYGCKVIAMDTKNPNYQMTIREPYDKTRGEHNQKIYNDFD